MKSKFKFFFPITSVVFAVLFSSCLKDTCKQEYQYKVYTPVYMSAENLRASVKVMEAQPLQNPGKIYYLAPYLFVNEMDKGIHIFDNSNPAAPQNIVFLNIPGNIDIAVKGDNLYADCFIDLLAFDISNPALPVLASRLENVFPNRVYNNGYIADETKGVVVDWVERDTMIEQDCNNFAWGWFEGDAFVSASQSEGTSGSTGTTTNGTGIAGSIAQFAIAQTYLYCLVDGGMQLYDISNTAFPQYFGAITMSWNVETIFPYEDFLFIGSTTGVQIYNNADPSYPTFISNFIHATACDPVVVQGDFAYSTIRNGTTCNSILNELNILDISDIYNPTLVRTYNMSNPYGLGIDGNYLFICDYIDGLKMYDVADANAITELQTVNILMPYDVIPAGGLLIVTADEGIYQYDYTSGYLNGLSFIGKQKL